MGFLKSTIELSDKIALGKGITRADAISLLHNHDFLLRCDPKLSGYTEVPLDEKQSLPDEVRPVAETKRYKITDVVDHIPAGIWGSTVDSTSEYTNLDDGSLYRLRAPLSVKMETHWSVVDAKDGEVDLIQESVIECSKPMIGLVKGQFAENLKEINQKIVGKLAEGGN